MGTDISEVDLTNINMLADQVINLSEYRAKLFEYLQHRMNGARGFNPLTGQPVAPVVVPPRPQPPQFMHAPGAAAAYAPAAAPAPAPDYGPE